MSDPDQLIRLSFQLHRDDNPDLYDELIRIPKGRRRLARLRLLAAQGMLVRVPVLDDVAGGMAAKLELGSPPNQRQVVKQPAGQDDDAALAGVELFGTIEEL